MPSATFWPALGCIRGIIVVYSILYLLSPGLIKEKKPSTTSPEVINNNFFFEIK
jgi:hypothetical protein